MAGSAPPPRGGLPLLPRGVLVQHVFPFLTPRTLARAAQVCREWRGAADEDVLWKRACARTWRGKFNVPEVRVHEGGVEEPVELFPFARYTPAMRLTEAEMRQVLLS